ncbi:MAG: GGDEF domain-containing protein, partial [Micromonosporaceae bacterium]|nr:GGDEF domain-containing protein [Micromonosporaceae bacterium]
ALHRAVQEQQTARRELAHRAAHDPLTGLPNRVVLVDRLEAALPDAALLLVDLDAFGEANDALGPAGADSVLVEVAHRIRGVVRHVDTVARLGRDEFAVLLPEASPERARLSAVRIMDSLRPACQTSDGRRVRLTASVGMLPPGCHATAAEALRDADLALSAARAGGRDRLVEFRPELREDRLRRARIASGLRQAMDSDELTIHYQPIVQLDTAVPVAMEALARWSPAGADAIPPSYFIPVAEQTGLVVPLGAKVLREACARGSQWHQQYGTGITVNISGRQLLEPDFADYVLAVLGETGLPSHALTLEITETVMVSTTGPDGHSMAAHLERLRSHGVKVAIDDFGTGYSSLSYLHRLPVDLLKIDREFIAVLDNRKNDKGSMFARAILRLGLSLQLETVAEGVETRRQADLLRSMGCSLAQGFLFARPADAAAAEEYLAAHREPISA